MGVHSLTFFPIGNADTTLIKLSNDQSVLIDYAHMRCDGDDNDKRIDLPAAMNKNVSGDFDVVCFTHADNDHICRFSEYFYLEHAAAYQSDDRKKIKELWVPANILVETNVDGDARILRAEARYRLKNKSGIRVFSRPKKLKDWCDQQEDICFDDIQHLVVNAGTLVPGFSLASNGVEFFAHSPFASDSQQIDRNNESIVIQATFNDTCQTKLLLGSDVDNDSWTDIVKITKLKKNEHRLVWDFFHISHHSSYLAIGPDKGENETAPNPEVKWLIEEQGNDRCRIISPSDCIPNIDTTQPPHHQAAAYYKRITKNKNGAYFVTMEHPEKAKPDELSFEIDQSACAKLKLKEVASAAFAFGSVTPRAGING
jgi:beta-lactamase superfamily II metal-dependent hydrolase